MSQPETPQTAFFHRYRKPLAALILLLVVIGSLLVAREIETSAWQASYLSDQAIRLNYRILDGASDSIRFPAHGPFDQRMGYTRLPQTIERLGTRGFVLDKQVRFSEKLLDFTERGNFPLPRKIAGRAGTGRLPG